MVGASACETLDLEVFWSGETKYPNESKNEGSCAEFHLNPHFKTKKMYLVIEPFEARKFPHSHMNLGMYSRSGCNVRIGISFHQDHFNQGQLSAAMVENTIDFSANDKPEKISDEAMCLSLLKPGMKQAVF